MQSLAMTKFLVVPSTSFDGIDFDVAFVDIIIVEFRTKQAVGNQEYCKRDDRGSKRPSSGLLGFLE